MNKQMTRVLICLSLAYISYGSVIIVPTIENPCQSDPTSTGTPQYESIRTQLQTTMTEATQAAHKCQQLKDCLGNLLTVPEINMITSSSANITGLPLGLNEPNLTAANAFVRTLRHSALNITILYNVLEQLVLSPSMETFQTPLRNVMSAMITVKCRIELTSEVVESNFTNEEAQTETEMMLADYDTFINLEERINNQPMPSNEKSFIFRGYSMALTMQRFMDILIQALGARKRSIGHL